MGQGFLELVSGFLQVALLFLGALGRVSGAGGDVLLDLVPPLLILLDDMAWWLRQPAVSSVIVVEGLLLSFEVPGAICLSLVAMDVEVDVPSFKDVVMGVALLILPVSLHGTE